MSNFRPTQNMYKLEHSPVIKDEILINAPYLPRCVYSSYGRCVFIDLGSL